MQRFIFVAMASAVLAVAAASAIAQDREGRRPRPERPEGQFDPTRLFDRLDADKEGVISLDKLPERLPERLREMLQKADADSDGRVTRDEFEAAMKQARKRPQEHREKALAERESRPSKDARGESEKRPEGEAGKSKKSRDKGPAPEGRPPRGWPAGGGSRPPFPSPERLFARMDTDKSGELSLEEFSEGMRRLREHMMRRAADACPPMGPPHGPPRGPSWHRGPGGRPPREPAGAAPREELRQDSPEAKP